MSVSVPCLFIVIPCYNEEAVVGGTADVLTELLEEMVKQGQVSADSRMVFVDDGSKDGTWEEILRCAKKCPWAEGIALQRNVGQQNALYAGLMEVRKRCDAAVSLDADLQDDPSLIPAMVRQFCAGNDVVYAVRKSRRGEGAGKRGTAWLFYRILGWMGADMPRDCGDFRLLSRKALEELSCFHEHNPFLRGLIPLLGLPSSILYFERRPRRAGKSKYSLGKMLALAVQAVTSLTAWPVYLVFWLGTGLALPSVAWLVWLLPIRQEGIGEKVLFASLWAAAGLLLLGIGIIGLYSVRIWQEVSGRPRYRIRERIFPSGYFWHEKTKRN